MKTECPHLCDVAAFLSGELTLDERQGFERHLAGCAGCRRSLEQTRTLVERLGALGRHEVRADLAGPVLARIRREKMRFWRGAAAIAAGLAVCAALSFVLSPGGNPSAVRRAHTWLCQHQEPDGSWDPGKWGGSIHFKVALTALPTLALLSSGTMDASDAAAVARSAAWLERQHSVEGVFGPLFQGTPYNQSLAALALLRAYERNPCWVSKALLDKTLQAMLSRQGADGAWGYWRSPFGDRSITEWHLEALRVAESIGWPHVHENLQRAQHWLQTHPDAPTPEPADSPSALLAQTASMLDFQRIYLTSENIRHSADAQRDRSLGEIRSFLMRSQEREGPGLGSWAPNDRWGSVGGRLYSTAMASLALGR